MTNYHKLFLDSTYRAPPFQPARPFFTLFNATNYWLQAALVIAVFIILNMMPFMRQAAHNAGGTSCSNLFNMLRDAFRCKEKVHDICNQTPKGHNERGRGEDEEENNHRRYKTVREARLPACPIESRVVEKSATNCELQCVGKYYEGTTLPPAQYRCNSRSRSRQSPKTGALKSARSQRSISRRRNARARIH